MSALFTTALAGLVTALLTALRPALRLTLPCLMIFLLLPASASPAPSLSFTAKVAGPRTVRLHWEIPPDNFLIRDSIQIDSIGGGARIAPLSMPPGASSTGTCINPAVATYRQSVDVDLTVERGDPSLPFMVTWAGCSAGTMYPQDHSGLLVSLTSLGAKEDQVTLGDVALLARAYAAGASRPILPWQIFLMPIIPLAFALFFRRTHFAGRELAFARINPWFTWPLAVVFALPLLVALFFFLV